MKTRPAFRSTSSSHKPFALEFPLEALFQYSSAKGFIRSFLVPLQLCSINQSRALRPTIPPTETLPRLVESHKDHTQKTHSRDPGRINHHSKKRRVRRWGDHPYAAAPACIVNLEWMPLPSLEKNIRKSIKASRCTPQTITIHLPVLQPQHLFNLQVSLRVLELLQMSSSQTTPVLRLKKGLVVLETSSNATGARRNGRRVLIVGGGVNGLTYVRHCRLIIIYPGLKDVRVVLPGSCLMQVTMSLLWQNSGHLQHPVLSLKLVSSSVLSADGCPDWR